MNDTQRLDFLIAHPELGLMRTSDGYSVGNASYFDFDYLSRNCATGREAIDEAITEHAVRMRREQQHHDTGGNDDNET